MERLSFMFFLKEQDSVESLQIITFLPQVKVSDKRACQFLDNQLDRAEIQEKCSVNCVYCHPKN